MFADNPKLYVTMVLGCMAAILAATTTGYYFELEMAKVNASKPCKCAEEKK